MQLPVTLRLKSSSALAVALVLAHCLALLGLMPTSLPPSAKFLIGLVLVLSLGFSLWRHAVRRPIVALTLKADGHLEVERRDGTIVEAHVHPHTTVFPWLVVLLLKLEGRTIALTLPADALVVGDHRQLRLWLRWKVAQGG